jgi:phage gp29-like protein
MTLHLPQQMVRAEKWREYLNPLIGLNIQTIVARLQASQLGIVSDLQWLYRFIERRDATLSALISRRTSAILELDWNIKQIPQNRLPAGATQQQAERQATALATFRGYAHLEKHLDAQNQILHLEPVPQWNWCRDGLFGRWCYNPRALSISASSPEAVEIDPDDFIIRECSSAVNEIGIICFIRKSMSQKDWDAFIEIYGLPPLFVELPPDVPGDQLATYQNMAESIMTDSRGVLPNGAKVQTVDNGARGKPPFADHIRYQDEQLVLAGTGGLLTMLTQSGSGTLAGNAHSDSFRAIAQAEARQISQCLQTQLDAPLLDALFPGQPHLAYWELAPQIASDPAQVISDVEQLARAGVQVGLGEIAEKSGYTDLQAREPIDRAVERAFQTDPPQK